MELPNTLRQQLTALVDEYLRQLPSRLSEIEAAFHEISGDPDDMEGYQRLLLLAHKLAGSGATFGFDGISVAAREMEAILSGIVDSGLLEIDMAEGDLPRALAKLTEACLAENSKIDMSRIEHQSEQIEKRTVAAPHREVILFSREESGAIADLRDQLGFFGFTAEPVNNLDGFKKLIIANPDRLAIIHTNAFEHNKTAGAGLLSLKQQFPDRVKYVFISEKGDFHTRLNGLRAGSDAYFIIPLDMARLIDRIDTLNADEQVEPYHVLIVDDDPEQVSYYALVLQQAGMITSVASDPMTVLNVLVEAKPELILMDMYMPGCSGTELLTIIRQQEAFVSIPVVFLSVENAQSKKLAAVREGGDDFITKPSEPEYLIASITNRMTRTRSIRYFMERDSLTGLLNHSNLKEQLIREMLRGNRTNSGLCFAMIDLDHFKKVNDTYGHLTGDKVLKSLSRILQERLRRTDIIGRYGGEEFGVILLNTTPDNAHRILEEIRDNFSHIRHQSEDDEFFVTFSCGIACFPGLENANDLTGAADKALYQAKESGRNQIVLSSE